MLHCETCLPVVVEQVVVETAHCLKFVGLKEVVEAVESSVGGVGCCNGVVETAIVIGVEHLGV